MSFDIALELYLLIAKSIGDVPIRKRSLQLRKKAFNHINNFQGFTKIAFDTRRINQGTEIIPRRGLQNYHRSESFITEAVRTRIDNLTKIKIVLDNIKNKYGQKHEWQDSNVRVLLGTIENGLRIHFQDEDYSYSQPSIGSLDYIDELLHVRYRLACDDINKLSASDLEKVILSKDEELTRTNTDILPMIISKVDVNNQNYDTLLNKLFDGCKASAAQPHIKRSITITIEDSFIDNIHKES